MADSARNYVVHAVLDDDSAVIVRAIVPTDKLCLSDAFSDLDADSIQSRFLRDKGSLSPEELEHFTEVDFVNHVALGIGLLEQDRVLPIGIGRYLVDRDEPKRAEIALTVHEMYRGIGVGTLMFEHLRGIAMAHGIEQFRAVMLQTNETMMHLLQRSRLPLHVVPGDGVLEVDIDITNR